MNGRILPDEHLESWYAISKRDDGHKKFHLPSVIFYVLDSTVFIVNIIAHASNRAYYGVGLTILIHFLSAWIISAFYKRNENWIDEDNVVFNEEVPGVWKWKLFRRVCQVLAITPLFRIIANWRDHKERHNFAREQRIHRRSVTIDEVEAIVLNKKRQCVKSYFDSLQAYYKTIPQCLLQVYIAVDVNLPLRFCTLTDVTRMITLAWTIIAASKATAGYNFALMDYLKTLQFQDYLVYDSEIILTQLKRHTYWISFVWNLVSIGARLYALSYILSFGGKWVLAAIVLIFFVNIAWMGFSTSSRPSYENPPSGLASFCSELIDRYINVFCFHMMRLNLKTVLIHQILFFVGYGLVLGTAIFKNFTLEWVSVVEIVDHTYHEIHSKCNFTIFSDSLNGFARILHEILNSDEEDRSNFKDLFSNEIVLITFMFMSTLTSIFYVVIYSSWAGLEDLELPLQNSIKEWKIFLTQNWSEVGPVLALKLVVLGVADSALLQFWKFNLSTTVPELKEFLHIIYGYVKLDANHVEGLRAVNDENIRGLLNSLSQYLRDLKLGDETDAVVDYFVKYFPICMKQMTSYRIAQIVKVVDRHNECNDILFCNSIAKILTLLPFCNGRG